MFYHPKQIGSFWYLIKVEVRNNFHSVLVGNFDIL